MNVFTAFPLSSPPLKIIFVISQKQKQLPPCLSWMRDPFLKKEKGLPSFRYFIKQNLNELWETTWGLSLRKVPSVAASSAHSAALNCADVESALGDTGEERRSRHSTAACPSLLPRGTGAGSTELNHFVQQLGSRQGQGIQEQLRFLQQEVRPLKEWPVISNNYVALGQKKGRSRTSVVMENKRCFIFLRFQAT